ncbi:DNA mismatch repair protein mutS [Streptococcus equi subsp. equi]|nr:DNA mismatch repair protein mutS [Streptococcus equi subsp. equi]
MTQLVNVHVATLEKDGDVTFLHKIAEGPADKSYGIHVAKIAGLPEALLSRADDVLTRLEAQSQSAEIISVPSKAEQASPVKDEQLSLFAADDKAQKVIQALEAIDVLNITPLEAMTALYELKKLL